jgi:hypothetical protein
VKAQRLSNKERSRNETPTPTPTSTSAESGDLEYLLLENIHTLCAKIYLGYFREYKYILEEVKMSDAYERERQNNSRLTELSAKVSALRGVTVDIYNNARDQDVIDDTVGSPFPNPGL